jgi:hypothetical protein
MRRWHQDRPVTLRQWWLHFHLGHDGQSTGCACDEQTGRFRKRRGMGCGRARCQLCHYEKVHGIKSHRQRAADVDFHEQLGNHE